MILDVVSRNHRRTIPLCCRKNAKERSASHHRISLSDQRLRRGLSASGNPINNASDPTVHITDRAIIDLANSLWIIVLLRPRDGSRHKKDTHGLYLFHAASRLRGRGNISPWKTKVNCPRKSVP